MDEIRLVENVIFFQELFIELEPKLDVVKVERIDFTEKAELFLRWSNDFETMYADVDWSEDDYIEKITAFAIDKIITRFREER